MNTPSSSNDPVRYQIFFGGAWVDAAGGETFESEDPFSGDIWAPVPGCCKLNVDRAVEAAHQAFVSGSWSAMTPTARSALLRRLGALITENARHLAEIEVRDNGKLMTEMLGQVRYLAQ